MRSERVIDSYLRRLGADLRGAGLDRRQVERALAEALDHLEESVDRLRKTGFAPHAAEREAIRLFGGTHELAKRFLENDFKEMTMLRVAISVLAALTIAAAFLIGGIAVLAPEPAVPHGVTALRLVLCILMVAQSVLALCPPRGEPWRRLTAAGAAGLLLLGVLMAMHSVFQGLTGPDPEPYIAVIGLIMATQGGLTVGLLREQPKRPRTA